MKIIRENMGTVIRRRDKVKEKETKLRDEKKSGRDKDGDRLKGKITTEGRTKCWLWLLVARLSFCQCVFLWVQQDVK